VVRNGCHRPRDVPTSAGSVEVTAPRVNDKRVDPDTGERQRFSSAILPAWARKTAKIAEVLPLLYLHGLSSEDFVPALGQFLGSAKGLSASTITKMTEQWKSEQQAFAERDLSGVDYVDLWADGIHVNVRLGDQAKLCLLVMIGVRRRPQGTGRAHRRLPRSRRVVRRSAARLPPPACAPRCSPPGTGRSGSGVRCARCSRRPASNAVLVP
jgi:transposase-like protein